MSQLFLSDRPRCFLYSISELFDIIVYYPDSKPALLDLKECLGLTRQRSELIVSLSSTFKKRLLIPGAMTTDIIQQFISTVKVLPRPRTQATRVFEHNAEQALAAILRLLRP